MANAAHFWSSLTCLYSFFHNPAAPNVIKYLGLLMIFKKRFGYQRSYKIARQSLAFICNEKNPVCIPVKSNAQICILFQDHSFQLFQCLALPGGCVMVGKRAV